MKLSPLNIPHIMWLPDGSPVSSITQRPYYAIQSALSFINEASVLPNHHADFFKNQHHTTLAEIDFGTGLSTVVTIDNWLNTADKPVDATLHIIAFEEHPLPVDQIEHALCAFSALSNTQAYLQLIALYPHALPGWHTLHLTEQVTLTLWFGSPILGIKSLSHAVDAWCIGTHSCQTLTPAFIKQLIPFSRKATRCTLLSSNDAMAKILTHSGFKLRPEYAKHNTLTAELAHPRKAKTSKPWFSFSQDSFNVKNAIVVGAGLAGAAVAYKLAITGWQVTVLESDNQVSRQASGNLAGAIHPLVTADWNLRSQWYLKGLETTLNWLTPWLAENKIKGDLTGLIHLAATKTTYNRMQDCLTQFDLPASFAQWKTAHEMSALAGTECAFPGLYFPQGGWVNPESIVKQCLSHPNITVHCNETVTDFDHQKTWTVSTHKTSYQAQVVVVATAGLDTHLNTKLNLPIRPVKGQVTHVDDHSPHKVTRQLLKTLTHKGYCVSLGAGKHVAGATFEAPDLDTELSEKADRHNLNIAHESLPNWIEPSGTNPTKLTGKIGFRPTSPDHLPIIGPVANAAYLAQTYCQEPPSKAPYKFPDQQYQPGLYVSNGHGARGLMSVFLAADIISKLIEKKPLNCPKSFYYAVHSARFTIKNWRKQSQ